MAELAILCRQSRAASDRSTAIGIVGPITHATSPTLRDHLRLIIDASRSPTLRLDPPTDRH